MAHVEVCYSCQKIVLQTITSQGQASGVLQDVGDCKGGANICYARKFPCKHFEIPSKMFWGPEKPN